MYLFTYALHPRLPLYRQLGPTFGKLIAIFSFSTYPQKFIEIEAFMALMPMHEPHFEPVFILNICSVYETKPDYPLPLLRLLEAEIGNVCIEAGGYTKLQMKAMLIFQEGKNKFYPCEIYKN